MLFPGGFSYLVVRPRLQLLLGLGEWLAAMAGEVRRDGWPALFSLVARTLKFQSSHWYTGEEFIDLAANNVSC